ncbi:hypothetical protein N7462_007248 [Penicillium macrosclerotiorum]|uniref:uncharacterized protein n=1 Tax=Penicillium macrosclerotiorum TaxID=303699 RepID=UPI0025487629|nr:uncharacterized protein N7462_007248 [Penicillium macrosclerotiorum]KAJ5679004.1 hypothetical protein N7462_007248 [Penicillium macrosclerotiorum]
MGLRRNRGSFGVLRGENECAVDMVGFGGVLMVLVLLVLMVRMMLMVWMDEAPLRNDGSETLQPKCHGLAESEQIKDDAQAQARMNEAGEKAGEGQ